MSEIAILVPASIEKYKPYIIMFIAGMLKKLDQNSHKDTPTMDTIPDIVAKIEVEITEFEEQLFGDPQHENTSIELFDIANFAFLAFIALRVQGIAHDSPSKLER